MTGPGAQAPTARDKWVAIAIATVVVWPAFWALDAFAGRAGRLRDDAGDGELLGALGFFAVAQAFVLASFLILAVRSRRELPWRYTAAAGIAAVLLFFALGPVAAPIALPAGAALALAVDTTVQSWARVGAVAGYVLVFTALLALPVIVLWAWLLLFPYVVVGLSDLVVDRLRPAR